MNWLMPRFVICQIICIGLHQFIPSANLYVSVRVALFLLFICMYRFTSPYSFCQFVCIGSHRFILSVNLYVPVCVALFLLSICMYWFAALYSFCLFVCTAIIPLFLTGMVYHSTNFRFLQLFCKNMVSNLFCNKIASPRIILMNG